MTWIVAAFVSPLLLRAVYTDVKKGIIENKLMAAGMAAGLGTSVLAGGVSLLLDSAKNVLLMFALLFLLYLARGIGAGDVKLFCVLAAFFQGEAFQILAGAFFVAAGMAAVRALFRLIKRQKALKRGETVCFSVPAAISTLFFSLYGVFL